MRAISVGLVVGLSWLFLPVSLCAQRPGAGSLRGPSVADVAILVREALGTPLPAFAVVRISSLTGSYHQTASTKENSEALFEGVPLGVYVVEVSATGYRTTTEEIELLVEGARNAFYISLSPEGTSPPQPTTSAPPVLAPKARKALDEALEALRKDDLEKAQKHLDAARKLAPNDPEVSYLYGVLAVKRNNLAEAQSHLERAVAILPRQGSAWAVLGVVFLRRNDTAKAISSLEQAVIYEPDGWQARGLLAATFLREKELEKARPHAERAVELTKGKIPGFRLVLAQILAGLGKMESAEQQLNQLLQEHPNTPDATGARRMLAEWGRRHAGLSAEAEAKSAAPTGAVPAVSALLPLPRAREDWAPHEVDEVRPEVAPDVSCSLPDVLAGAGRQVQALVNSLERITATERILYEELNRAGDTTYWEDQDMNYVVSFLQPRPETLFIEEFRKPLKLSDSSPRLASKGLVALALLFHPVYSVDFEMKCAGLGQWQGRPAWIVDFYQRADRPVRVRNYRTAEGVFNIRLKGRAWIHANSYHIARLETDLLEPVPEVRLTRDHLVIEYGPVQFTKTNSWLWLPMRAELYSLLRDRWYRVRHTMSDYMLFSIETRDKIAPPQQPPPQP